MNKIKLILASGVGIIGGLISSICYADTFSTTSLGTAIDSVSGTTYDYFTVLIAKFWPFLLGAVIIVGVVVFGKRIIHSLFGGGR